MKTKDELTYLNNKREYNRDKKRIVELKKEELASEETCENCGSTDFMEYHHVLPLKFLGTNEQTNIKRLCKKCHAKIHFGFKNPDKYMHNNPFEGIQIEALFPEFLHESCDSCKKVTHSLKMRMVVPHSVGGQYVKGNLATFCKECNNILDLNTNDKGILNHSKLIKLGLKQAKENGIHLGRPFIDRRITNAIISTYLRDATVKEAAKSFNFSISSLYRYKKTFDNKYIFQKINNNEFNLLDINTKELLHHFNLAA